MFDFGCGSALDTAGELISPQDPWLDSKGGGLFLIEYKFVAY